MPDRRLGDQTLFFPGQPRIEAAWTVVGPHEGRGPRGAGFHTVLPDDTLGESSCEKTERRMLHMAVDGALAAAKLQPQDIDVFTGGDLLNQIVTSSFVARGLEVPFLGLYAACATFGESLGTAACLVDGGYADRVLVGVASHYQTAERQYRTPVELNVKRTDTSQTTVTGAGAAVIGHGPSGPRVTMWTVGSVVDAGERDTADMGCAMAPAAAATLIQHLSDTGQTPGDYDLIVTGDLAAYGSKVFRSLVADRCGWSLGGKYVDAGTMVYGPEEGSKAGASGCGCSAVIVLSYVLAQMRLGALKRVLAIPTGSLHSPMSSQQGETMPCIAHAIALEV